ncbi:hypothetical protein [Sandaracinus amylolyticus]|uniref:Uncharacterized protein n=1 Tax=Sandaracinus amylolyticus TaxID=927083 RepID=A0A0F6W8V2_9BACT|nr:hypothetical protein [Sandaracinus amylolyticus]AKF10361.1 hypothetical protein DB32_007510 [Sandaracinus amylolyticus]
MSTSLTLVPSALRSTRAVLAGALVVAVVSTAIDMVLHATGIYPPLGQPMAEPLFVLALGYRVVVSVAGGWLTARLAPARPMTHVGVLGAIGLLAGTVGAIATWDAGPEFGPKWYGVAVAATALPSVWLGGLLRGARA